MLCFLTFLYRYRAEMEGVKEKWRQNGEEKDSNEAEDGRRSDSDEEDDESSEVAALAWQEGYDEDNLSFPIMHWEALSLRIAELEKQEELKKEQKAKVRGYGFLHFKSLFESPLSCHSSQFTC